MIALYTCMQAHVFCTSRRAKVAVVALSLGALTAQTIKRIVQTFHYRAYIVVNDTDIVVYAVLLPVTVFIINMVVLREVRRASNSAAVNLGLQQHHQSTSSNSAVPTVMLVTTSLLYVLLTAPLGFLWVLREEMPDSAWCSETWTLLVADKSMWVMMGLYNLIFAYNFFVYVITSKQFRSELRQLFSRHSSADNNEPIAIVRTPPHGQAVISL